MKRSNLRGRGGAGFPTGLKWESARNARGRRPLHRLQRRRGRARHVQGPRAADLACRARFRGHGDRRLSPSARRAASSICAANTNICASPLEAELERMRGERPARPGDSRRRRLRFRHRDPSRRRRLCLRRGIGADRIAGGQAGQARASARPSRSRSGYLGKPTVVDNVETLAQATEVAIEGGARFAGRGTRTSTGTKILSVSGDCERPGLYEYPFGVTVAQVLEDCGARDVAAVQVSGPSGVLPDARRIPAAASRSRTCRPPAPSWCSASSATYSRSRAISRISSPTRAAASARPAASARRCSAT